MNPKVSIILPIFKVENYLRKCVDSIIAQTLEDIEIILATDGPEACDEICREYEKQDSRVKVVFHPGSYGKAFNRSLEIAAGEYVGIVETDDWCDSTMFEKLYAKAKVRDADVVKCGFYFAFDDSQKNYTVLYDGYDEDFSIIKQPDFLSSQPAVWSCIYRKDFLQRNNITMIEERMSFIDAPFHYETLCKAERYILLKEPLYYYYQDNPGQTVQNIKTFDGLNAEKIAYPKIHQNLEFYKKVQEGFLYSTALHLKWNIDRMRTNEQRIQFWEAAHEYVKKLDLKYCKYKYLRSELKTLFERMRKNKHFSETLLDFTIYPRGMKGFVIRLLHYRRENGVRTISIFGIKIHIKNYFSRALNKFRKLCANTEIISAQVGSLGESLKEMRERQEAQSASASERVNSVSAQVGSLGESLKEMREQLEMLVDSDALTKNAFNNISSLFLEEPKNKKAIVKQFLKSIEIEVFSFCNRQCWFCPNKQIDRKSSNVFLSEPVYEKILSELAEIDYCETITFSRYNEPLSDKIILDRIRSARKYCPNAYIRTNSNGDYLTRTLLDELARAGMNELEIQCYFSENEVYSVDAYESRLEKLAEKLGLKNYRTILNWEGDRIKSVIEYEGLKLYFAAYNFKRIANNRGNSLDNIIATQRNEVCLIPCKQLYIDYDGSYMLCCNVRHDNPDHANFILGNAKEDSVFDIFSSRKMIDLRKKISTRNTIKDFPPCNSCSYICMDSDFDILRNNHF